MISDIKPQKLRLRDFVPADQFYHVGRTHIETTFKPLHTHDFAELFWIESGSGVHVINGKREPLAVRDLVFIRPADCHAFQSSNPEGLTLVNVAFPSSTLVFLRRRYIRDAAEWPWRDAPLPLRFGLDLVQMKQLQEWQNSLATGRQSRLHLEAFLLDVLNSLLSPVRSSMSDQKPDWLQRAVLDFNQPHHLENGTAAFARLAGRCPEHVNRVIRKTLGKTTTDVVNELRLEHAARELRMTARPIVDIAMECGLANLGYFYRLFQKQHGMTPRRFRLRHQEVIRGKR